MIGLGNGYQRGFWLSLAQYTGLLAGVLVGAALARPVLDWLQITNTFTRPLAAVLWLVVGGSLGSSAGYAIGEAIRGPKLTRGRGRFDGSLGAAFSGAAVLAVAWFLGLSFSRGPVQPLATQIQASAVLRALDAIAPRPPGFLSGVESVLANVPFPQTFAGLAPQLPGPLAPPASINTPGVQAAAAETLLVAGRGCGGEVTGSGYPVATGYVVTNAHVVSGTSGTTVSVPNGGRPLAAHVVLFDSERDVAVLQVPGLRLGPLPQADAGRGTQGAVIGYPGGGPLTEQPAVVDGAVSAQGRDIYNQNLVTRQIWILEASVHPGNSGGPVVDLNGRVIGLVFAASSSNPNQSYALTNAEIAPDLQQAQGRSSTISTSAYPCAV